MTVNANQSSSIYSAYLNAYALALLGQAFPEPDSHTAMAATALGVMHAKQDSDLVSKARLLSLIEGLL